MATIQLTELIPVETELGFGYAILVSDDAHDTYWTVAFGSGAMVTFPQDKVRLSNSYTYERGTTTEQMKKLIK